MPEHLLNPQERQQIEALVASDIPENVRRRAQLILLLDDGQPTQQAAGAVGITPGRARHWRGLFRSKGMDIFPHQELPEKLDGKSEDIAVQAQEEPIVFEADVQFDSAPTTPIFQEGPAFLTEPGVLADDVLSEAGRKVLAYHFNQMLLHEEGTRLGVDIEELHDMRVATRRMRAAFEVFADAYTK
jgi:hypothetical protein